MQVEVKIHSLKPCTFIEQSFMSAHAFYLSMLLPFKNTYCKTVILVISFIYSRGYTPGTARILYKIACIHQKTSKPFSYAEVPKENLFTRLCIIL